MARNARRCVCAIAAAGRWHPDHGVFRQRRGGRGDSDPGGRAWQGDLRLWIFHHLGRVHWRRGGQPDGHQSDHGNDDIHLRQRGRCDPEQSASNRALHALHSSQCAEYDDPGFHAFARSRKYQHDGRCLGISALAPSACRCAHASAARDLPPPSTEPLSLLAIRPIAGFCPVMP